MAQPHAVQLALIGSRHAPACPPNVALPHIVVEREFREEGAKIVLLYNAVNPKTAPVTTGGHHHHGRNRKSSSLDRKAPNIASVSSLSSSAMEPHKRHVSSGSSNSSSSSDDDNVLSIEKRRGGKIDVKKAPTTTAPALPPSLNISVKIDESKRAQSTANEEKEATQRPSRHGHRRSLSTSEHLHFATKAPPTLSAAAFQPRDESDEDEEVNPNATSKADAVRTPASSSSDENGGDVNDASSVVKVGSVNGDNEQDGLSSTASSVRSVIYLPTSPAVEEKLPLQQESTRQAMQQVPSNQGKGPISRVISTETGSNGHSIGSPKSALRIGSNSPHRRPRRSSAPDLDSIVEVPEGEQLVLSPPKSTDSKSNRVRGGTPLHSDRSGGSDSTRSSKGRRHFRQYSAPVIGGGVDAVGEDALTAALAELKLPDGLVITKTGISSNSSTPDRSHVQKRSPILRTSSNFKLERGEEEIGGRGSKNSTPVALHSPASAGSFHTSGRSVDGGASVSSPSPPTTSAVGLFNVNELEMLGPLGRGSAGRVTKALHVSGLKIVAVKSIQRFDAAKVETTIAEIRALYKRMIPFGPTREQSSENIEESSCILGFYDAFIEEGRGEVNLVLEFMDGGSLQDLVDKKKAEGQVLPEEFIAVACRRMLMGLCELYDDRLLHRDMKPANVLVSRSGAIKLSDFGVSVAFGRGEDSNAKTYVGTVGFMAPERVTGKGDESEGYSYASDLYGLGLIAYVCATGDIPFNEEYADGGIFGVYSALAEEETPKLDPTKHSAELVDFVTKCLQFHPEERPSPFEHLNHPFVRKYADQPDLAIKAVADQLEPINQEQARVELNRLLGLAAVHHIKNAVKHDVAVHQFSHSKVRGLAKQLGVVFQDEQREIEKITTAFNEHMVTESGAAVMALTGHSPSSLASSQGLASPRMGELLNVATSNSWKRNNLKLELPK